MNTYTETLFSVLHIVHFFHFGPFCTYIKETHIKQQLISHLKQQIISTNLEGIADYAFLSTQAKEQA